MNTPNASRRVFVYDTDESDCDDAVWLLGKYGLWRPDSGLVLGAHSNRNELLAAINAEPRPSLALIDLRAVQHEDFDYVGHRIIGAIRRHSGLGDRCRPVALTRYPHDDVCELARRHGAFALISYTALEARDADARATIPLAAFLKSILDTPALAAPGPVAAFSVFPSDGVVNPTRTPEEERAAVAARFKGMPTAANKPYFWHILRYYADKVDRSSIIRWIATDYIDQGVTESEVKDAIEEMSGLAALAFRSRGLDLSELARDLLVACPHRRPAPTDTMSVRTMHRLQEIRSLANDHDVIEASWIDPEALQAVRVIVRLMKQQEAIHSQAGQWLHIQRLEETLAGHEPDETRRAHLRAALVRGTYALFDTYRAMPHDWYRSP